MSIEVIAIAVVAVAHLVTARIARRSERAALVTSQELSALLERLDRDIIPRLPKTRSRKSKEQQ